MRADGQVRLKIDLAYDGTLFSGWAKQPGLRTVQGELERALAMVTRRGVDEVQVTVAGRTDAGVHATGQTCHVDLTEAECEKLSGRSGEIEGAARKLNGALKRSDAGDLIVHSVTRAPEGFDARFSALSRTYEYRVTPKTVPVNPLRRHAVVALSDEIDLDLVRTASLTLLGLQDFTTYCKAREGSTAVRTLIDFSWERLQSGELRATIHADAFCHSMVRSIVGGVLAVGAGKLTLEQLQRLTAGRERSSSIPVMPAHGLTLVGVAYPEGVDLARRAEVTRARRDPLAAAG